MFESIKIKDLLEISLFFTVIFLFGCGMKTNTKPADDGSGIVYEVDFDTPIIDVDIYVEVDEEGIELDIDVYNDYVNLTVDVDKSGVGFDMDVDTDYVDVDFEADLSVFGLDGEVEDAEQEAIDKINADLGELSGEKIYLA